MMATGRIAEDIKLFFKQVSLEELERTTLLVFRQDGMILHACLCGKQNHSNEEKLSLASWGALLGGVWQSALALIQTQKVLKQGNQGSEEFRLSFDTSSKGLHILPFCIHNREYYICMMYENAINPGLLKNKLRLLAMKLQDFIMANANAVKVRQASSDESEHKLFSDISDDEIDKLFSFIGH